MIALNYIGNGLPFLPKSNHHTSVPLLHHSESVFLILIKLTIVD